MTQQDKDDDSLPPASEKFQLDYIKNSDVKISHKYTLGSLEQQTFCVRYDPNDKYIAQGSGDGTINIFNTFTGKQSYILN